MADKAKVWRGRLAAWRSGDLSAAAFCRQHGLPYATFGYWQRKLRSEGKRLVPVRLATAASPATALALELRLPHDVQLHVRGATAADLVALVRGLSC
jgi:hypothetical protein